MYVQRSGHFISLKTCFHLSSPTVFPPHFISHYISGWRLLHDKKDGCTHRVWNVSICLSISISRQKKKVFAAVHPHFVLLVGESQQDMYRHVLLKPLACPFTHVSNSPSIPHPLLLTFGSLLPSPLTPFFPHFQNSHIFLLPFWESELGLSAFWQTLVLICCRPPLLHPVLLLIWCPSHLFCALLLSPLLSNFLCSNET